MKRILLALILLLPFAVPPAMASMYRFDTTHSQVLFSVSHNRYSMPVGRMHIADGWLRFDPEDWSHAAAELDIDLAGVDMGDADWNQAVRGHSFLNTAQQSLAHFKSTSVERTNEHSGILHGVLTLRGISRPVGISFTVNRVGATIFGLHKVAGFSARATLIREAFGMKRFSGSIGHKVDIRLEIEAILDRSARNDYLQRHPRAAASHAAQ